MGAVGLDGQAQFHPLKFVSALAEGLRIREQTFVKELGKKKAITDKGEISFEKLIVATHFPMDNKHGLYFLKMYQHRSYVMALQNAPRLEGMYVDEAQGGMSFRRYKEYLLLGGGGARTGKKSGNGANFAALPKPIIPGQVRNISGQPRIR